MRPQRLQPDAPDRRRPSGRPRPTVKLVPRLETLEHLTLLSAPGTSLIVGHVNDAGAPVVGEPIALLNNNHQLVATTQTNALGNYAFIATPTIITTTQILQLPSQYTNVTAAPFSSPLNRFSSSLGQLLSVTVTTAAQVNSSLTITNNGNGPFTPSATLNGVLFTLDGLLPGGEVTEPGSNAAAQTVLNRGATQTLSLTSNANQTYVFDQPSDLAAFIIRPSFLAPQSTVSISAQVSVASNANGNQIVNASTMAKATVAVTYQYALPSTTFTVVPLGSPPGTVINGLAASVDGAPGAFLPGARIDVGVPPTSGVTTVDFTLFPTALPTPTLTPAPVPTVTPIPVLTPTAFGPSRRALSVAARQAEARAAQAAKLLHETAGFHPGNIHTQVYHPARWAAIPGLPTHGIGRFRGLERR